MQRWRFNQKFEPDATFQHVTFHDEARLLAMCVLNNALEIDTKTIQKLDRTSFWPARMQWIDIKFDGTLISWVVDSAHNPSGIARASNDFTHIVVENANICLLIGSSPQIDIDKFLEPIVELCNKLNVVGIVITEPSGGRYSPINAEELLRDLNTKINPLLAIVGGGFYCYIRIILLSILYNRKS